MRYESTFFQPDYGCAALQFRSLEPMEPLSVLMTQLLELGTARKLQIR
jgi:hypothetical protein